MKNDLVSVFYVFKEQSDQHVFCQAFGVHEIEIPDSILKKYGKIKNKTEPDAKMIMENKLIRLVDGTFSK